MDPASNDAPGSPPTAANARLGQGLTISLALIGGLLGAMLVERGEMAFSRLPDHIPAPHGIPKAPGGTPLALAMIDDILCERFDRPGPAWYAARNRLRQAAIDASRSQLQPGEPPSLSFLAPFDDLSTGHDLLGQPIPGIAVQEDKLERMQRIEKSWIEKQIEITAQANDDDAPPPRPEKPSPNELALYRGYANLGTHLIHAHLPAAMRGDRPARRRTTEGLTFLKLAVAINPDAHFGREIWQIVACEFLLAAIDRPELLTTYDIVGNLWRQGAPSQEASLHTAAWPAIYARLDRPLEVLAMLRQSAAADDDLQARLRAALRTGITPTGAAGHWKTDLLTRLDRPVPFDEPTLGILGMWTLGGGANPHFALALAGICEDIGQFETAWRAYERAAMLADRFSSDAALQQKLLDHCRARQAALLPAIGPDQSDQERRKKEEELRDTFQRRLQAGLDRRAAREKYEAEQVAAGKSPDDPKFYEAFNATNSPIHTAQSHLDLVGSAGAASRSTTDLLAGILLLAGAGALIGQLFARYLLRA